MNHAGTTIRDSVSAQLYNDLLTGIQVGEYPALSRLPTEASLAQDYGVSRSVVRAALSVLKKDGVVVSRQGSGTMVAANQDALRNCRSPEIDIQELVDCYKCRESMEPDIAAYAAANRTDRDLRYLAQHANTGAQELASGIIHTGNDADFHFQLARMTGNKFFERIIIALRPHILIGMNLAKTLSAEDRNQHQRKSILEHQAITKAVVNGDCDAARLAMREHLVLGQHRIFAGL